MDVIQLLKEMRFEGDKLEREVTTSYKKGSFERENMTKAFKNANILLGQVLLIVDVIKRGEEYDEKARKKIPTTIEDLNGLGKKCQLVMDLLFEDVEFKSSLDNDNSFAIFTTQAIRKVYECITCIVRDLHPILTKKE